VEIFVAIEIGTAQILCSKLVI